MSRCAVTALLNGTHPATGTAHGRAFREPGSRGGAPSVRGFNATFNAPKSVSVLWAAADARTRDEIIHGHRAAVRAVLSYVERTTSSRARAADEADPLPLPIVGITAATLHLHVSGSGDPHLHSVALITTKVRTLDGRWLALDARPLMREQQTLSRLYHAALQGELASRLAVRWASTPSTTLGHHELLGVNANVLAVFSCRTEQVTTRLADKTTR